MRIVKVGGRALQVFASGTISHDYWLKRQIRLAGIDQIEIDPRRNADDTVAMIVDRVIDSGMAMTILGGLLAPEEMAVKDWTPAVAEEMASFLNALIETEDKTVVRGLVAEVILGFFLNGLVSLRTSRMSSRSDEHVPESPLAPIADR